MLPSLDLGSIIVKSLESSLNDLDEEKKDGSISDSVTEGINKSVLAKSDASLPAVKEEEKTFSAKSESENQNFQKQKKKEVQTEGELKKKNLKEEDKQRKNLFVTAIKGYSNLFKGLESNLKGTFEKTFSAVATFTSNPLEGLDRGLQAVIKGSLGAVDKLMNTQIKLPGAKNDGSKEDKERLAPVTTLINEKSSKFEEQIKTLIDDNKIGNEKINTNLVQLSNQLKMNDRKGDSRHSQNIKEGAIKEKKRSADAEKISGGIAQTNLVLGTVGQWVGMIGLAIVGAVALWPVIWTYLNKLWASLEKWGRETIFELPKKIGNYFSSWFPYVVDNISDFFQTLFGDWFKDIKLFFTKIFDKEAYQKEIASKYGMSVEEYENYKAVEDEKEKLDKLVSSSNENEAKLNEANKKFSDRYYELTGERVSLKGGLSKEQTAKIMELSKEHSDLLQYKSEAEKAIDARDSYDKQIRKANAKLQKEMDKRGMTREELEVSAEKVAEVDSGDKWERFNKRVEERKKDASEKFEQGEKNIELMSQINEMTNPAELDRMRKDTSLPEEVRAHAEQVWVETGGKGRTLTTAEKNYIKGKGTVINAWEDFVGDAAHDVIGVKHEHKGDNVTYNNQTYQVNYVNKNGENLGS
jgi:hypothetical protein